MNEKKMNEKKMDTMQTVQTENELSGMPEVGGDNERLKALHLRNQLCFPLYACAREMVKQYKPYLDRIGLTYTQYITMLVLWEHHSVTAKDLGERLYLDSGTLTPLLKRMEARGLLTRRRDPADERSLRVTITEEGERLREQALDIPYQVAKLAPINNEDGAVLYRLLYDMLEK